MTTTTINPIQFASQVNEQFLDYQLTAFPLTDPDLAAQARSSLHKGLGHSPLIQGPYVSLSKSFRQDRDLRTLASAGIVHPALPALAPYPVLFAHQDETLLQVQAGKHCLIATGTGSGKTEAFLYPILNHCLRLRDEGAPDGVVAVLVYPMNALAIDQLGRLRQMLVGSGISFGMYIGTTPADDGDLNQVVRLQEGEGRAAFERYADKYKEHERVIISPAEERLTEREMAARPPRLLLTNVNQLELLLTRGKDLGMFIDAPLKYLVFDEAHTYTGAVGAEVSCLIRRLRSFCGKSADDVICIGTSATVTDLNVGDGAQDAFQFAHRFFGVDPDRVALVREQYETTTFPRERHTPLAPQNSVWLLAQALDALETYNEAMLHEVVKALTGEPLAEGADWSRALYEHLRRNEYVYALFHHLDQPLYLPEAVQRIQALLGRSHAEVVDDGGKGELLCYLVLGAAAEFEGNPLLRPKVHYFIKGLEGAVLTFVPQAAQTGQEEFRAELHLSLAAAMQREGVEATACPPLLVCKNCGQHYLEGYYHNFLLAEKKLSGGDLEGDNELWEVADEGSGNRVLFTNRFISEIDADDDLATQRLDKKRHQLYFCRYCGTLHRRQGNCEFGACKRPGPLVPVWAVQLNERGRLMLCPCCRQRSNVLGERVTEPIKALRAVTVADVHILAQNMINALRGPQQKLIVFADNRQDAAFQAGWMQDHARRYRLRHLIYDFLQDRGYPCSITDIREHLLTRFRQDRALARTLAPEVFSGRADEAFGHELDRQLSYYLHILLVREWSTSFKQRDSLETWGKARVIYAGVTPDHPWIHHWAERLALSPEVLAEGIASLLDAYRRNRLFYDSGAPIFARYWREGDDEVQRGFLPFFDFPPKGLKEQREANDRDIYVAQFRSKKGQTLTQNYLAKWHLPVEQSGDFITALWPFLTDILKALEPITLLGPKQKALAGATGVYQVSAAQCGMQTQHERYRCNVCQRVHTRVGPRAACTAMHCKGTLQREEPPVDDYNIAMLDLPFSMLTAREHSAQVPPQEREAIEEEFKKAEGRYNCLVATPTLEMGVDIGALDMVLMRNAPPKPSNYWQRAGRAGRRYRMAVIYTYCRRSNHDSYFFEDPTRMLAGRIETPRFNLHNEVMLRKHVHAAILSEMLRLSRQTEDESGLSPFDLRELQAAHEQAFPDYLVSYLFDEGNRYRQQPYQVDGLHTVISKHRQHFLQVVQHIFAHYWPERDRHVVGEAVLARFIDEFPDRLQEVIDRLHGRLLWAVRVQERLLATQQRGLLDPEEERMLARCKRYLQQLAHKDMSTYTLTILATEAFLPGYGTYEGGIKAFASRTPVAGEKRRDFELTRMSSMALREYVPGNLIYANGGRFRAVLYHFPIGERQEEIERYQVDTERERIAEVTQAAGAMQYNGGQSGALLRGMAICDVDLAYISRISDEESNRFQLPVAVLGYLKQTHRGGNAYSIQHKEVQHRFGQHLRLVNVGPADRVRRGDLGYPVCTVCGALRSPYASERELEHFVQIHSERCGKTPEFIAITTDGHVDGILFQGLDNREAAVNLGEALRIGATRALEMESQDLQLLPLPQADGSYHLFLYDPMPGGSGLLQQLLEQWETILPAAVQSLSSCEANCKRSCYNCMRTYRNSFYHDLLDRHVAIKLLGEYQGRPRHEREFAPVQEAIESKNRPTNRGEEALAELIEQAGLPRFEHQHSIDLGKPLGTTTPDLYYDDPVSGRQLAIYLDGLSKGIHGNKARQQLDRVLRESLEEEGIDVIEIAASDLDDPEAMKRHLKRISMKLRRR